MARTRQVRWLAPVAILPALVVACVGDDNSNGNPDSAVPTFDAAVHVPGVDATTDTTPSLDATAPDSTLPDASATDGSAPDTGAPDTGADSGAHDASDAATDASDASDAATDASDAAVIGTYVDAVNGSDTGGNGTQGAPFKTLDKAIHVATSGATILLAAGQYTGSATPVRDGVGIQATIAGQASVVYPLAGGGIPYLTFAGSGFLRGVVMDDVITSMSAGTIAVDGVQFLNFPNTGSGSSAPLVLSGTAHVILTPGSLSNYIGGTSGFLTQMSGGTLEVHGGAILGAAQNTSVPTGVFQMNGGSLLLDGVTIDGSKSGGIYAGGSASVTVQNKSVINNCHATEGAPFELEGTPTVIIDDSKITNTNGNAIEERNTGGPSVTLRNGAIIDGSASDAIVLVDGTITLNGATISNNKGAGVNLASAAATVNAINAVIQGNGTGIRGYNDGPKISLRGTQVTGSTNDGLYLFANDGTSLDLGTASSPGGNTFAGNNASDGGFANLNILSTPTTTPLVFSAISNTWDPNIQGADANGHFPSGTTFTASPASGQVNGRNVNLIHSGSGAAVSVVVTP
jgi:hypothetical protein